MKTILGKLVSVQPISLSKAARYISDFASFENNGASEVVSIYLNRASEAFSSLVQLHKDLKHPQSSHKKRGKKSNRDRENATSLRNDETMNCDDGERKSRSHDEDQGILQDKRVKGVAKEEDGSLRVGGIEDMGTSKKRKEMHKKRKENETKTMGKEGEMEVEPEKKDKKKKREEVEITEMRSNGKLDVGKERESKKKKSKTVDLDDDLKENIVDLTRKKRKKSKVAED